MRVVRTLLVWATQCDDGTVQIGPGLECESLDHTYRPDVNRFRPGPRAYQYPGSERYEVCATGILLRVQPTVRPAGWEEP